MYSATSPFIRYLVVAYIGMCAVSSPFFLIYGIWWISSRIRAWIHHDIVKKHGE